jgi:hypothetical protein
MTENYDRLCAIIEDARADVDKASGGNKAATARVRKAMQAVKATAQDIRKEMLELRDGGGGAPAADAGDGGGTC